MYNEQRNAQVFNLFIYLLLPYMILAAKGGTNVGKKWPMNFA
jgi:hypothetical protein